MVDETPNLRYSIGCIPLGWSGSGSMIKFTLVMWHHLCPCRVDPSVSLLHHNASDRRYWSWSISIPKGTHPPTATFYMVYSSCIQVGFPLWHNKLCRNTCILKLIVSESGQKKPHFLLQNVRKDVYALNPSHAIGCVSHDTTALIIYKSEGANVKVRRQLLFNKNK